MKLQSWRGKSSPRHSIPAMAWEWMLILWGVWGGGNSNQEGLSCSTDTHPSHYWPSVRLWWGTWRRRNGGAQAAGGGAVRGDWPWGLAAQCFTLWPTETNHDIGEGTVLGHEGMAAHKHLWQDELLWDGGKVSQHPGLWGTWWTRGWVRARPQGRIWLWWWPAERTEEAGTQHILFPASQRPYSPHLETLAILSFFHQEHCPHMRLTCPCPDIRPQDGLGNPRSPGRVHSGHRDCAGKCTPPQAVCWVASDHWSNTWNPSPHQQWTGFPCVFCMGIP